MCVELAAVRALAPYFGSSVFVWTNVIGMILAALSLGYFLGGRLADRWQSPRPLGWVLLLAGIWVGISPYFVAAASSVFFPDNLRLEDAGVILWGGSLAVGCLLFGIPAFLISFSSPTAIRFLGESKQVGTVAGSVFALSTIGSLLGTFLTTHLLIPVLGTRASFLLAGLILILLGALLVIRSRNQLPALLVLLIPTGFYFAHRTEPIKTVLDGEALLAEGDTAYQYLQIVRRGDETQLRINEGLDSYQSLWKEGKLLTGAYYDLFLLAPDLAEKKTGQELKVLIIGLAAGTIARQYEMLFSSRFALQIDGVEIDESLVDLAREPFALEEKSQPHLQIFSGLDGRVFLDRSKEQYDLILVDAYAGQVQIPFQLCSQEFFLSAKNHLKDGGVLAVNVGSLGDRDPVRLAVSNTMASVFQKVLGFPVRAARNEIFFVRKQAAFPSLESRHEDSASDPILRLLWGYAAFPGKARWISQDVHGIVLKDEHSPIEILQGMALWKGAKAFE